MIKLTDRLQVLADQIEKNETMADIGTDHGFLPIYLWENGISPRVIMSDVSAGSLKKAEINAATLHPDAVFDLRLGNGIQVLENGEVDAVVLAGMGGILMTEILEADPEKSQSFHKYIFQPRSGQGRLRWWLVNNGFPIVHEALVREGKYICEIITARPERICSMGNIAPVSRVMEGCGPDDIQYEVPPWILSAGELTEAHIKNKLSAERKILSGLGKSKNVDEEKVRFTENRIKYLTVLLGGV
ncbi:class I SAM-dependent methyltransferase [Anaerovorax odorimutans]|uniref:Class I SAM-dependent methyltransferase n=1 Tax=Anaerovorax odorimutans TaxID=109327 RepID=A0ABT1RLA7_9FIRM|nr:class I SAM-dependent methyltransferase [Anaerovorax odorimutans]MCQ4635948.1 class I SAM-dependent methyltransferase [Anaerovorax odorimutans]